MATVISKGILVKVGTVGEPEIFKGEEIRVYPTADKVMRIHITTVNSQGRRYERDKTLRAGEFLFGTVEAVSLVQKEILRPGKREDGAKFLDEEGKEFYPPVVVQPERVLVRIVWDGSRYRTSTLPGELVDPAINLAKR